MSSAFKMAADIVQRWGRRASEGVCPHRDQHHDGSRRTRSHPGCQGAGLAGKRGRSDAALHIHLSSSAGQSIELARQRRGLPDKFSKQLYEMSSALTRSWSRAPRSWGCPPATERALRLHAQPTQVIQFLDIGTRPANLR